MQMCLNLKFIFIFILFFKFQLMEIVNEKIKKEKKSYGDEEDVKFS